MSRFTNEFQRLYAAGPDGAARALVLDVGRPSDWDLLGAAWRGVQHDLGLPAPGIAIAGENSYQLWFSLQQGVAPDEARGFFDGLVARYLGGIAASRIRAFTEAPQVPVEVKDGQWSAFVAPDLAPVFVEATWLDIPPGAEGQADVLKALKSIAPAEWQAAMAEFKASANRAQQATEGFDAASAAFPDGAHASSVPASAAQSAPATFAATNFTDPRAFLLQVMNDGSVPLALRLDAAKALLP